VRVEELLYRSARRYPGKAAVICNGRHYSYEWVHGEAARLAASLSRNGVQPGSRVGICLENSIDAIVWMFAVAIARATFFILSPQMRPDRLQAIQTDARATAMIARDGSLVRLKPDTATTAVGQVPRAEGPMRADLPDEDLAAIVYTSGSTGTPKGVMLTHANLCAAASSITTYLANTADDVIFSVLPLSFTYGLGQVTTAFLSGATLVLGRSVAYPRAVLDTLAREQVTGLPLVPTMATLLLRHGLAQQRLPSLRYITNAAAALSEDRVRQLQQAVPRAEIFSMYGQTECQRATFLSPELLDTHPASVGRAIPGATVAVVNEHGNDVPPGTAGELVVRGPQVMRGYWNQPEATAQALRQRPDGEQWLFTGDLFRQDADGLLYFVERRDALIKSRGEKVAPRAVEEVISRLPGVADVGVYGIPDELLGHAVAAAVTLEPGASLTPLEVQRHCLVHLESYMVPKVIEIRASLPTTTTGKINRAALLQEAAS
jgi:amino acid adenylation domain-containing protein